MSPQASEVCQKNGLIWFKPRWAAPAHVRAGVTTRHGGVSGKPYSGLNLAGHVADTAEAVAHNRRMARENLGWPAEPVWLAQVHGTHVVELSGQGTAATLEADAAVTRQARCVCAVLTADCLPVLLTDREGSVVAAAHAGWRGLAAGVLEQTVKAMAVEPARLLAWIGPAISVDHYAVGDELRQAFVEKSEGYSAYFYQRATGTMFDLAGAATYALHEIGVGHIVTSNACTFAGREYFYSYRRDGETGRMASFIYLDTAGA